MSDSLPPGAEVWAYIRVSSEQQADKGLPVQGQRDAIERFCQERGLHLTRVFLDEARSGSTDERPQFRAMVSDALNGRRPSAIVMWSWSRFSRDQNDAMFYKASLRRAGVEIITIEDDIPRVDGFENILEALVHWKDEQYLKQLSQASRRGQQALARMGYVPAGGPPPYGYRVEMEEREVNGKRRCLRRWVPDPTTAPLARRAWEMRLAGSSLEEIHRTLRIYGHASSLSTLFSNPAYKGRLMFGSTVIELEALVSEEEWQAVQDMKPKRRGGAYPRRAAASNPYLLTGLARCGLCGSVLDGEHTQVRKRGQTYEYRYYRCHRRRTLGDCEYLGVRADVLERTVVEGLCEVVLTEANLAAQLDHLAEELEAARPRAQERVQALQAQLSAAEAAVARLVRAIESSEASEALLVRLREREGEVQTLRSLIAGARAAAALPAELPDPAALRTALLEAWKSDTPTAVRRLLQTYLVAVEASKEGVRLLYRFPFPASLPVQEARPAGRLSNRQTTEWRLSNSPSGQSDADGVGHRLPLRSLRLFVLRPPQHTPKAREKPRRHCRGHFGRRRR